MHNTATDWMDAVKVASGNRGMPADARVNAGKIERVESPGTYITECVSCCHFCLDLCSFGPPSRALVAITWRVVGCRYMLRLGSTVKRVELLKIKESRNQNQVYGLRGVC